MTDGASARRPDMHWPVEAIQGALAPLLPGFRFEVLPQVDSTNTELMRRARAGRTEPVLLVAECQTAGRGRLGRSWHSAPGASLTFSLALPLAPLQWSGLSLAVGVCLAESLHAGIGLKWPNDLWWQGRKLGGILVETAAPLATGAVACAPRQVVIGVGINIALAGGEGLATAPAALRELWPEVDAGTALARVAAPLVQGLKTFETAGFATFQPRFDARDVLKGRRVTLSDSTDGMARGVNSEGALLVHTAAAMTAITSAEVSVRPA